MLTPKIRFSLYAGTDFFRSSSVPAGSTSFASWWTFPAWTAATSSSATPTATTPRGPPASSTDTPSGQVFDVELYRSFRKVWLIDWKTKARISRLWWALAMKCCSTLKLKWESPKSKCWLSCFTWEKLSLISFYLFIMYLFEPLWLQATLLGLYFYY